MKTKMPLPNTGHLYIGFEMVEWCRENCPNDWTKPSHDRIVLTYKEDNDRFVQFFRERLAEFESENDPDSEQIESLKSSVNFLSREVGELTKLLTEANQTITFYKEKNSELETKIKSYESLREAMGKIIGEKPMSSSVAPQKASTPRFSRRKPIPPKTSVKEAMRYNGDVQQRIMLRRVCEHIKSVSSSTFADMKANMKITVREESAFNNAVNLGKREQVLDFNNGQYYLGKN